jgi:hypothetical protein
VELDLHQSQICLLRLALKTGYVRLKKAAAAWNATMNTAAVEWYTGAF